MRAEGFKLTWPEVRVLIVAGAFVLIGAFAAWKTLLTGGTPVGLVPGTNSAPVPSGTGVPPASFETADARAAAAAGAAALRDAPAPRPRKPVETPVPPSMSPEEDGGPIQWPGGAASSELLPPAGSLEVPLDPGPTPR